MLIAKISFSVGILRPRHAPLDAPCVVVVVATAAAVRFAIAFWSLLELRNLLLKQQSFLKNGEDRNSRASMGARHSWWHWRSQHAGRRRRRSAVAAHAPHDRHSTMNNARSTSSASAAAAAALMRSDAVDVVDATGVSPRFVYHDMDVVVVEHAAMDEQDGDDSENIHLRQRISTQQLSNRSSFATNLERKQEREKRFACQFDPSLKNGRSLVLRFDVEGNSSFEEVSRVDMLRMTQEAATPALGQENAAGARAQGSVQNVKQTKLVGPTTFGTICDVQRVHARDIRKLDTAFSVSNEPSIELRNQAILINADPVRAIIMRNTCLVFVPDGADSLLSILRESFREATHPEQGDAPYEFKALEALLSTLCRYFETDYEKRAPVVSSALDRLAHGRIAAKELETLRTFKNTMNEFESQVDGVRRALMEILDNEEDLRLLYLTKLYEDPTLLNDLWSFDSEEAEVLIENYLQDIFSTRTKASLMQHRIQNTESLVMLKLDSMRNYLLGVDILFSIVAISVSVGTFIAGIFGMNLRSDLNQASGWFWGVTCFSIGIMFVIGIASYLFFRRQGVFL